MWSVDQKEEIVERSVVIVSVHNSAQKPLVLLVLDGVGLRSDSLDNSFTPANAPFLHDVMSSSAMRDGTITLELKAHGGAVGLPSDGDMGNSEVGHNIMGAGRVFPQGATQVSEAFKTGRIWTGPWLEVVDRGRHGHTIHFIGLLSDGNVHSHSDHLKKLLTEAASTGAKSLVIHVMLDGRDVLDHTAHFYLADLEGFLLDLNRLYNCDARIGSGGGRMTTTMDRYGADWSMVERGYNAHVRGVARQFHTASEAVEQLRREKPGVSDQQLPEFTVVDVQGRPLGSVQSDDAIVLFNFRGDRMIEIYQALTVAGFSKFHRIGLPDNLLIVGLIQYDGDLKIPKRYLVEPSRIDQTCSEVLAAAGIHQAAVAETQKFGHITYFWNGNRSSKFDESLEYYQEIQSNAEPFEHRPWMKSAETADEIIRLIASRNFPFIRANFAGGDMVGHTGNVVASRLAVGAIDVAVKRVWDEVSRSGGTLVVTADHGNCEMMWAHDSDGRVMMRDGVPISHKSHTLSPVPFVVLDKCDRILKSTYLPLPGLANVAPTLLTLLGITCPAIYEESLLAIEGARDAD